MSTFKAYLITPAEGPREYDTVRDRAKARARELGGTSEEVELPATKGGLVPFLNAREAEIAALGAPAADWREEVIAEHNGESPAPIKAPSPAPVAAPTAFNATNVCDWLLDSASQRDIELAFEALGARFGEAIRPRRAA